jgi:hypothetical protein
MIHLFMRHTVPDYDAWHKAWADFQPTLKAKGVAASAAYRAVDNPNDVTVIHDFSKLEDAKAFVDSAELKAARAQAGVKGVPDYWFAETV